MQSVVNTFYYFSVIIFQNFVHIVSVSIELEVFSEGKRILVITRSFYMKKLKYSALQNIYQKNANIIVNSNSRNDF